MSNLNSKQGKITALTHIFYIQPKSIFLELSEAKSFCHILIRNRDQLKKWRQVLLMRQWIRIDNLKSVTILGSSSTVAQPFFETTLQSSVFVIEKGPVCKSNLKGLISYQGEITDDTWGSCGFYTLDHSLILCLSYLKLISSIPVVKKGDKIILHDAHHLKLQDKVLLYLCGRGNLSNKSLHEENASLFPKPLVEDTENSLQHFALNCNCDVISLFCLFELIKKILERFTGILPADNLLRKSLNGGQNSVVHGLLEHITKYFGKPYDRYLSKEFLDHDVYCKLGTQEFPRKIEDWTLDASYIEAKCEELSLWSADTNDCISKASDTNQKAIRTNIYWRHEIAVIDSKPDQIFIIMGVLTFQNGVWQLTDNFGSVNCILADRLYNQFKDRSVFATKFYVHRESFLIDSAGTVEKRIYITTDELHAATLPVREPSLSADQSPTEENVRFLLLSKSMSMMIFSSDIAKRHIFGFLVTAAIYGSTQPNIAEIPAKHAKQKPSRESRSQNEAAIPANCVFVFSNSHINVNFPALNEGKVYEISLSMQQLLKQRIILPPLKDIPQSALKNQVFMIPDNTGVHPVAYPGLPKSDSYMHGDVLSVEECLCLEDVNQTVSIRGWILDRMHIEPRYGSERHSPAFADYQGTWLGIPGNKKVILRVGASLESSGVKKIDVYFCLNERQVYPFGLLEGSEIELTWLCLRRTQKTSRIYCTSTLLTGIRIHQLNPNPGQIRSRIKMMKNACIGRRFFTELVCAQYRDACSCVAFVRYVHKLSIRCVCFGCDSEIKSGGCTYVGCHWTGQPSSKIDLKAW